MIEQVCSHQDCNEKAVFETNAVYCCDKHAVELCSKLGLKYRSTPTLKLLRIHEFICSKRPLWFNNSNDYEQATKAITIIQEIING